MNAPRHSPQPMVRLDRLDVEHIGDAYLGWLADPIAVRFTEARFAVHDLASVRAYVESVNNSPNDRIWRVLADDRHVGNVKLSTIDRTHARAAVAILVGDRSVWGRGIAPKAIELAARYAFDSLGLHKLVAGIYSGNDASLRAFLKAGFHVEATLKENRRFDGRFIDEHLLARFASPPAASIPPLAGE